MKPQPVSVFFDNKNKPDFFPALLFQSVHFTCITLFLHLSQNPILFPRLHPSFPSASLSPSPPTPHLLPPCDLIKDLHQSNFLSQIFKFTA
jgi:hypothetical protein